MALIDSQVSVHPTLPEGGHEVRPGVWDVSLPRVVASRAGLVPYHRCGRCKGFVAGEPAERRVNTLAPLSGRCGTEWTCRRCGWVLHFDGIMS